MTSLYCIVGMRKLKKENCDAQPTAIAVKDVRNTCISTFLACKRAEDRAVALVATCGQGEVKTADGRRMEGLLTS